MENNQNDPKKDKTAKELTQPKGENSNPKETKPDTGDISEEKLNIVETAPADEEAREKEITRKRQSEAKERNEAEKKNENS